MWAAAAQRSLSWRRAVVRWSAAPVPAASSRRRSIYIRGDTEGVGNEGIRICICIYVYMWCALYDMRDIRFRGVARWYGGALLPFPPPLLAEDRSKYGGTGRSWKRRQRHVYVYVFVYNVVRCCAAFGLVETCSCAVERCSRSRRLLP